MRTKLKGRSQPLEVRWRLLIRCIANVSRTEAPLSSLTLLSGGEDGDEDTRRVPSHRTA